MVTRIEIMPNDPNYLVWAGDGTKDDANAIFYIKNNGAAYFGGSLSAGALVNEVKSELVSPTQTLETGIFGTNGTAKTVTFSTGYSNYGRYSSNIAGSNTGTLILERSYNAGGWVQVATAPISGNASSEYDSELGYWLVSTYAAGSGTFVDTLAGSGTFNYRVRLVNPTGYWPYMLGPPWQNGGQTTIVKSVEG